VPKVAQICEIPGLFGCFLPGNKDSNPSLEDPDFLSPAKKGQRVGSLNLNPWIRNNTRQKAVHDRIGSRRVGPSENVPKGDVRLPLTEIKYASRLPIPTWKYPRRAKYNQSYICSFNAIKRTGCRNMCSSESNLLVLELELELD
jgi:hypothetical protein